MPLKFGFQSVAVYRSHGKADRLWSPEVLDEATSALDVATEKLLYSILVERGVAVIRFLADNSPINPVISSTWREKRCVWHELTALMRFIPFFHFDFQTVGSIMNPSPRMIPHSHWFSKDQRVGLGWTLPKVLVTAQPWQITTNRWAILRAVETSFKSKPSKLTLSPSGCCSFQFQPFASIYLHIPPGFMIWLIIL
jgi:hypothetical protein